VGGVAIPEPGLDVAGMFAARLKSYLLLGPIEPALDCASPAALEALKAADFVVALTPFESAREFADVILPIAAFAETSGTWVNLEGRWQSVAAAARAPGDARPGWKVLRVLGNLLGLAGFDYDSSEKVRQEFGYVAGDIQGDNRLSTEHRASPGGANRATTRFPMYAVDAYVRRSAPLQQTRTASHEDDSLEGAAA